MDKAPEEDKNETNNAGITHTLQKKSLRAAGLSFLAADLALISSSFASGDYRVGAAGAFGITAGAVGARYGNPKAEKQLDQLYRQLGTYLRKEGVKIPDNINNESLSKEGGIVDHIESFLYGHPSQVMNLFYGLIGTQFIQSGLKRNTKPLFFSGCFLIAGALGGVLIQEKKPDPEHPPHNAIEKALSWIQEKPLRLTGTLFNLNQVFLATDAIQDRKLHPASKSYLFKLIAVAAFLFGNTMFAISSKGEGGGGHIDKKILEQLGQTSAYVIASQPKEVQDGLLEHVAGFLASRPGVDLKAPEISVLLQEKLAEVTKAPLAQGWGERVATPSGAELNR